MGKGFQSWEYRAANTSKNHARMSSLSGVSLYTVLLIHNPLRPQIIKQKIPGINDLWILNMQNLLGEMMKTYAEWVFNHTFVQSIHAVYATLP